MKVIHSHANDVERHLLSEDPLRQALRGFRQKTKLKLRAGNYIIKTAENEWDAQRAVALRKYVDPKNKNDFSHLNIDLDFFDHDCDYLIVIEKQIGRVVGAARLSSSFHGHSFPASENFQLDIFLTAAGHKLECGKLCVDPTFRNGSVIDLLMRGIAEYARVTETRYLFGTIGGGPIEADSVVGLMKYLSDTGAGEFRYSIEPKAHMQMTSLPVAMTRFALQKPATGAFRFRRLPSFMRFFTNAGAKVCLSPALDRERRQVSFFSLFDFQTATIKLKTFSKKKMVQTSI